MSQRTSPRRSFGPRARRLGAAGIAAVLVVSLSACDDHVGAAADVAGTTISESAVTETTGELLADTDSSGTGSQQYFNRKVLTDRIRHELVGPVADELGVTVDPEQLNSLTGGDPTQAANALGVLPDQVPQALSDALLAVQIAQHDASSDSAVSDVKVTIDLINFDTRTEAVEARSEYLADPAAMDTAVKEATAAQNGGTQSMTLFQQPALAAYGLFTEPVGSVLLLNLDDSYSVARVSERSVEPGGDLATAVQSAQQLTDRFALAWLAVGAHAADEPVSVNPRFGTWDPVAFQVVPTNSGL